MASRGRARTTTPQRRAVTTTSTTANGRTRATKSLETLGEPTNEGENAIIAAAPYIANIQIQGTSALLFHRWSNEAVAEKAAAAKGSAAKKTDDIQSYVYRLPSDDESVLGNIGLPGEYLRMSLCTAAKFRQDPRSPRKSAFDLFKAAIISLTELADMGSNDWDYLDARRVMVQRSAVTRQRPAFNAGWVAEFQLMVNLPEYVSPTLLQGVLFDAGRLIGLGDFRPTFGRFTTVGFSIQQG